MKVLRIPDNLTGQIRKCPHCRHPVSIPVSVAELPTLELVETEPFPDGNHPETASLVDDQQLARQLRNQAAPADSTGKAGVHQLVENASQQGRALFQRARDAVQDGVKQTRTWFQVRKLQRELHELHQAQNQKLLEVGTAALEQGAEGLQIDAEKRRAHSALKQITECQNKLNAVGGDGAKSSIARDLNRQLIQFAKEKDEAVTDIGRKAFAAGRLNDQLRNDLATLDSMIQTHQERLTAIAPKTDGGATSGFQSPGRRLAFAAALCVGVLGAGWIGFSVLGAVIGAIMPSGTTIASLDDEEALAQAVGMVVCGEKVVLPDGKQTEFPASTGTAFAITPDGYMLTNKHVVATTWNLMHAEQTLEFWRKEKLIERTPSVWVFLDGEKYPAEIMHVSSNYDMAILKIERSRGPYFRVSTIADMSRNTQVTALGFPGASQIALSEREQAESLAQRGELPESIEQSFKSSDYDFILTAGTVSRMREDKASDQTWIQHNADINPGNSGGPLVTEDGIVVGINTLGITNASGTFYSLTMPQLRSELDKHVPYADWE